jgi:hypothetical protein
MGCVASKRRLRNWSPAPGRGEVQAAAIAEPERKPPGRKDTRQWCRGKTGREHQPTVVLAPYTTGAPCHLPSGWQLDCWPETPWTCAHREACSGCGKILRDHGKLLAAECPDYPGDGAVTAANADALARYRAAFPPRTVIRTVIEGPQHYRRKKAS